MAAASSTPARAVARLVQRRFLSSSGKVLSEEEKAARNVYIKRRRSRINEKMKALQSLIPISNKTDKASILDGAIEYLKQLQPQVQKMEQEKLEKLTRTLRKYIISEEGEQASSTPSYAANDAKTGGGPTESTSAGVLTDKNRKYPVAVIIEMGFKPEFPLHIIDED